ncbi:MAG: hypothetical protein AAFO29_05000 [Actinomycetota bacterium]
MTEPGTQPGAVYQGPPELPSIRQRKPLLYWTVIVGVLAMLVPIVAGLIQVLL